MATKISERSYLLEAVKIFGLLLWYLLHSVSWIVSVQGSVASGRILMISLFQVVAGYIVISLCFRLYHFLGRSAIPSKKSFVILLFLVCCMVSVFWNLLSDIIGWIFKFYDLDPFSYDFFISTIIYMIPALAFTGAFYMIDHWINFKQEKEKALVATSLAHEAQLQMLRYQINPHFLFNALNTIRQKVEEDKDAARRMITELANFFRYSLSQTNNVVTFDNEINAIKNYLEIQKIRFEEKLQVIYDLDENATQIELPFFIVLPLVENAIKFGLQTSSMPLTIKIRAKLDPYLTICVQNTGKIISVADDETGTKTGVLNIRRRLELCHPGNFTFTLSEKNGWVTAEIVIRNLSNGSI